MKRLWLVLTVFLGLASTAVPASAALVFTLNCDKNGCANNYGTVTLNQVGAGTVANPYHVEVEVNLIAANNHFAGTGAGYAINWNITGNPSLTTNLIATAPASAHPPVAGQIYSTTHFHIEDNTVTGKTYKASPFSDNWMYAIDYNQSGGGVTDDNRLLFDVKKTTGNLLLSNFTTTDGVYFAVDIYNTATGKTFVVAANDPGITVPEPGTWTVSMAGLAGLAGLMMLQRRRKLARAI